MFPFLYKGELLKTHANFKFELFYLMVNYLSEEIWLCFINTFILFNLMLYCLIYYYYKQTN